jgi:parallel beta-helix repeat protein
LVAAFVALFLSSMLLGALFIIDAGGQTLPPDFQPLDCIYIRADGSVEGTDSIHRDRDVYTFTSDIQGFEAIVVERDSIVVDGAGYAVRGDEEWKYGGFRLDGRTNVTIKNVHIIDSMQSIYLNNSSNNIIANNTLTSKILTPYPSRAIRLENFSNHNKIYGNTIEHEKNSTLFTENVVDIRKSLYNEIVGNNITSNMPCIGLDKFYLYSNHTIISGNTITFNFKSEDFDEPYSKRRVQDASFWGFNTGFNTTFSDNILVGCCLYAHASSQNTIVNNLVDGKPISYLDGAADQVLDGSEAGQIILENCQNIKVKNYDFSNIVKGGIQLLCTNSSEVSNYNGSMYLENSFYNRIIRSNCVEIALSFSSNNTITRNTVKNSEGLDYSSGVTLRSSHYNTITENNMTQNFYSYINLQSSNHNLITYNGLTYSAHGISFGESSENTVHCNNVAYNHNSGIFTNGGTDNLIFQNNFIGSYAGGYASKYIWDNGTIGNYWDNYNGTDENNDGIGDVPYCFSTVSRMGLGDIINCDNYPLMKPPVNLEAILDFSEEDEHTSTPEPFPTAFAAAASITAIVVVGVGLLVYSKRKKAKI